MLPCMYGIQIGWIRWPYGAPTTVLHGGSRGSLILPCGDQRLYIFNYDDSTSRQHSLINGAAVLDLTRPRSSSHTKANATASDESTSTKDASASVVDALLDLKEYQWRIIQKAPTSTGTIRANAIGVYLPKNSTILVTNFTSLLQLLPS
jgi:hypothetical protein